jgi:hypothetical protein
MSKIFQVCNLLQNDFIQLLAVIGGDAPPIGAAAIAAARKRDTGSEERQCFTQPIHPFCRNLFFFFFFRVELLEAQQTNHHTASLHNLSKSLSLAHSFLKLLFAAVSMQVTSSLI